jgi:hypothetical protein
MREGETTPPHALSNTTNNEYDGDRSKSLVLSEHLIVEYPFHHDEHVSSSIEDREYRVEVSLLRWGNFHQYQNAGKAQVHDVSGARFGAHHSTNTFSGKVLVETMSVFSDATS